LLSNNEFIVFVATTGLHVAGSITACELQQFEQDRHDRYIYDLAVSEGHRRNNTATKDIE
jgi:aminoglycoside 3-N-acetyltransferase I